MPTWARWARRPRPESADRFCGPNQISPWVRERARVRQRRKVVLPAPERPITATNSPGSTVREMRSRARRPPKSLLARSSLTIGELLMLGSRYALAIANPWREHQRFLTRDVYTW